MTQYPGLDTVQNSTTDISQLLVYVNHVTSGAFGPLMLYSFFLVVFVSGYFAQKRFTGRPKPDTAWLVAGFVTFGLALIMSMQPGLLHWTNIVVTAILAAIGLFWTMSQAEP